VATTATSRFALGVAAIVVITALAYVPSLGGGFVMDDFDYVTENPAVTEGVPLSRYFLDRDTTAKRPDFRWQSYRPVRTVAFRLLAAHFGARPLPFKLANLTLYGLGIVLVALLARRVGGDDTAALVAAAWWALMAVHVEPVLYVSSLGDHLSLVFQLAAFLCVARAVAVARLAWLWALGSLLLAALAMGAKEMAVTEAGLLALAGASTWARLETGARRRTVILVALHGALTLGFLALRTHVLGTVGQGNITLLTLRIALRAAPICLWRYVLIVLAPLGHSAAYAAPRLSIAHALAAWLGLGTVAVVAWRWRRAPLLFALGWFALSLLPVLHVVPLLAYYADRFVLVPSIGLALAAAVAIATSRGRQRAFALAVTLGLTVLDAGGVLVEGRAWRDDSTLWRYAVAAEPEAALAQSNLAIAQLHEGRPAEAIEHLLIARRIAGSGAATAFELAVAYDMLGHSDEAERAVDESLAAAPTDAEAHALRGALVLRRGDLAGAMRELAYAQLLAPTSPTVLMLAGQVAEARGQADAALAAYRGAVAAAPNVARYRYAWARAALAAGQAAVAVEVARACVAAHPERPDCLAVLGRALAAQHDVAARAILERVLPQLPDGPERRACLSALQNL
jgi:tetratricopeptide (TPR) repeat protein